MKFTGLTESIDNYTAAFSAYSNLQFVDIAGLNQDTVYIATNSTNVIQYNNGVINVIGSNNGISATVNSIGIQYTSAAPPSNKASKLIIGTNNGYYTYNMDLNQNPSLIEKLMV